MDEKFRILDWDTKKFGYKVASICCGQLSGIELKKILEKLRRMGVKLVYWFVDFRLTASNRAAKENGGFLVGGRVIYSKKILSEERDHKENKICKNIRPYLNKPINDRLLALAFEAGKYSRFRLDPHFKRNEFEIVYTEWIKKSLNGRLAKEVFVYLQHNVEVGFVTLRIESSDIAKIDLIAVDKKSRKRSVGSSLVKSVINWCSKNGYKEIKVITQKANWIACNFYEKLGFSKVREEGVYHFWL